MIRQHVIKYSTFVLRQLTFGEGFAVYQGNSMSLCEPLNNLCTEDRAESSSIPFYRRKKKERENPWSINICKRTCLWWETLWWIQDRTLVSWHSSSSLVFGEGWGWRACLPLPTISMPFTWGQRRSIHCGVVHWLLALLCRDLGRWWWAEGPMGPGFPPTRSFTLLLTLLLVNVKAPEIYQ